VEKGGSITPEGQALLDWINRLVESSNFEVKNKLFLSPSIRSILQAAERLMKSEKKRNDRTNGV
jgi:hypothetical protein